MASNAASVARTIRLFRDQSLSPAALSSQLAAFARKSRDGLIQAGDAPPSYLTVVDGHSGASEDTVRPDGAIIYYFNVLGLAAAFALAFCKTRSPMESGRYRDAWFVAVDGQPWDGELNDIPAAAEVMIVNPVPYARKIDAGHMKMSVPPGIVEAARQAVQRKYPTLVASRQLVTIPSAFGGGYVLRGIFHRGFRPHARKSLRPDTQKGQVMTYPALIIARRV